MIVWLKEEKEKPQREKERLRQDGETEQREMRNKTKRERERLRQD